MPNYLKIQTCPQWCTIDQNGSRLVQHGPKLSNLVQHVLNYLIWSNIIKINLKNLLNGSCITRFPGLFILSDSKINKKNNLCLVIVKTYFLEIGRTALLLKLDGVGLVDKKKKRLSTNQLNQCEIYIIFFNGDSSHLTCGM